MTTELFSTCPVCDEATLSSHDKTITCEQCGFSVKEKHKLFSKDTSYQVSALGSDYNIAAKSIVGETFTLQDMRLFREHVYSDETLDKFAKGDYEALVKPSSTLASILLEQLRETCYMEVNGFKRALGPTLEVGANFIPQGIAPTTGMDWQDEGNLFLTNARLIFPSNTFTFLRMDRKLIGVRTYENGIALQRKGEDHAMYFVGCKAYQAALIGAYIQGKVPALRS